MLVGGERGRRVQEPVDQVLQARPVQASRSACVGPKPARQNSRSTIAALSVARRRSWAASGSGAGGRRRRRAASAGVGGDGVGPETGTFTAHARRERARALALVVGAHRVAVRLARLDLAVRVGRARGLAEALAVAQDDVVRGRGALRRRPLERHGRGADAAGLQRSRRGQALRGLGQAGDYIPHRRSCRPVAAGGLSPPSGTGGCTSAVASVRRHAGRGVAVRAFVTASTAGVARATETVGDRARISVGIWPFSTPARGRGGTVWGCVR